MPAPAACRSTTATQWASRLPAEFPAYPGGRVTEAAGNDRGDCRIRVVTFTTADPDQPRARTLSQRCAARAGYLGRAAGRAAATRCSAAPTATAAYYLIVTPDPGRLRSRADRQQRALDCRRELAEPGGVSLHRRHVRRSGPPASPSPREDDGIRLDRWFRRNLPEVELRPDLALGADRPAPRSTASAPRPATGSRPARRIRVPPQGEEAPAPASRQPQRRDAERRRDRVRPRAGDPRGRGRRSSSTSRPASPPRAAPRPRTISTGCSTASPTTDAARPKLVHRLDKDTSGALLVARTPRAAAFFSKSFSGRTARKVYWAIVTGVPVDRGRHDRSAARQAARHGRREDACRRGGRAAGADPLPGDRARRQPRRLGRAAAAHRPHPPAARPHGGDRPPDRRRRQIWRARTPS